MRSRIRLSELRVVNAGRGELRVGLERALPSTVIRLINSYIEIDSPAFRATAAAIKEGDSCDQPTRGTFTAKE